ncbi:hypothetical protein [Diplocloster hominis]|uniref:hypothetical protein n=1 Tax=Diplocloster hominis TaxID=3079010 RepID=UPI0031B9C875
MNSKDVFHHIVNTFCSMNIKFVILHSYQNLPEEIDSDIDFAIKTDKIETAIHLLDSILQGTGWRMIQFWRHEYYAADCVISNDEEFIQVDFCIHYERNGRILIPIDELIADRKKYNNFFIPSSHTEFSYILIKKILKRNFSERSKIQLNSLWLEMSAQERELVKCFLHRFLNTDSIESVLTAIEQKTFQKLNIDYLRNELLLKSSNLKSNIHYILFDILRKMERILHPTGMFIVLMGVDGAGKTTIADELIHKYETAFRRVKHYHSRVRVLNDISRIGKGNTPIDASDPHGKTFKAGRILSLLKFGYYFIDYMIGNLVITKAKIQSSLVLIERYYYDYYVDKIRYNINLPTGFLKFFSCFMKKPDVIFILTGDSQILFNRKHEITIEDIEAQKEKLEELFLNNNKAFFIDTTVNSVSDCVNQMLTICNEKMRGRRRW